MNFLSNIPIGQYVPGTSFVHRLDPRSKLLFILYFIILVFMADEKWTYGIVVLFSLLAIFTSRISLAYLLNGLKPIWWVVVFTVIIHLTTTQGGDVVFTWKWLTVYREGLNMAILTTIRLVLLVIIASLLTLTTSPLDLTDGIEKLFQPFTRFGFPAHELAMMMSIALRFIPTLLEETEKIMKAQISRGADFETGNIVKKVKSMIPLLIPLFISAFRRAEELALAMESRGYRGAEGRTKLRELSWSRADGILLILAILLAVIFIFLKR
ncbi:MAG TPA: energy-coupling factor transporter transmembrane component T [Bacillota bacterium]|nr:energy-coupling factor transporter transmembrane component T [Bacillota bacterium]